MIVASIASLAVLAGLGLMHEVHTMNPARRLTEGGDPQGHRGGGRDVAPDETAQRRHSATVGDQ